ncbi:hypothetical protein Nos7524_1169 [Nostoc sp. PCC 7524]|uniref:hypothetical protein n=1 Tax=Nostoc sp. (strain ATCC 29411 / PCC 7524) TaxID=28072 RepID=UPI00029ED19B|nr:hypothetical protein [Nostoc sp. PCC 7524]AFY47060.1 hypothetical protein Nos7524_1169 [Nostoc sp. PCC 7524]
MSDLMISLAAGEINLITGLVWVVIAIALSMLSGAVGCKSHAETQRQASALGGSADLFAKRLEEKQLARRERERVIHE